MVVLGGTYHNHERKLFAFPTIRSRSLDKHNITLRGYQEVRGEGERAKKGW